MIILSVSFWINGVFVDVVWLKIMQIQPLSKFMQHKIHTVHIINEILYPMLLVTFCTRAIRKNDKSKMDET